MAEEIQQHKARLQKLLSFPIISLIISAPQLSHVMHPLMISHSQSWGFILVTISKGENPVSGLLSQNNTRYHASGQLQLPSWFGLDLPLQNSLQKTPVYGIWNRVVVWYMKYG